MQDTYQLFMLPSPKERFATSTYKDSWSKVVATESFMEAASASLLELQAELPVDPTPNQAADAHNKMLGARRFLEILSTIHQVETKTEPRTTKTLNWSAGV